MRYQFEVLTVPTSDTATEPTIVLSFDDKRYIFNCGEGTQRQMIAQKIPLRKIRHVFLTYGWQSHGGIAGLLLGAAGQGELRMSIHGPKNIAYYLASLRAGQQRSQSHSGRTQLQIHEYDQELPEPFEDNNVTVQPVVVFPDHDWKTYKAQDKESIHLHNNGPVSSEELMNPDRIQQVAHSVWSGQFLVRRPNGTWKRREIKDTSARESLADQPQMNSKKRPRPISDDEIDSENQHESKNLSSPQDENTLPSPSEQRAFWHYMNADLPPSDGPVPAAVSYFIQGRRLPGKFDPIRAKLLHVSPGPDFGRLQKGFSVLNQEGHTILPAQVMGPERICSPILILHCPTIGHISNLVQNPFWSRCQGQQTPAAIIHSCGNGVFEDTRYIKFMASFGSSVEHFLSRPDFTKDCVTNIKANFHQNVLRHLSSDIYPRSYENESAENQNFETLQDHAINACALESSMQLNPFPILSVKRKEIVPPVPETPEYDAIFTRYEEACARAKAQIVDLALKHEWEGLHGDLEITTLGTGSAGPSNYRNVAGTLVRASSGFSVLLDCGEGTLGQLKRTFGNQLSDVLQSLRLIFISHMHADHHLGLVGVLTEWIHVSQHHQDPLFIVCSEKYSRSITEYASIADMSLNRITFLNSATFDVKANITDTASNLQLDVMHEGLPVIKAIKTVATPHSERSMCFRLDHRDGWSIAYSGDTRPNAKFSDLGANVTCLIHEATFEDDKLDEAVKKRHSTISEALQVSSDMCAQSTILTHFSQRYGKLPLLKNIDTTIFSERNIGLASDLMRIKVKHIWQHGYFLHPQMQLAEELEKMGLEEEQEQPIVED